MGTGSDEGAPGEHHPPAPLTEGEASLLDGLMADSHDEPLEAVEDTAATRQAAEDDTVLPAPSSGAAPASQDDVRFQTADGG